MATFGRVMARTMKAAFDMRTQQYHIVRQMTADGETGVSSVAGGVSQRDVIGIIQNKPNSGQAASIGYFGESKVVAGGTCTAGRWLTTDGSGHAVNAASGDFVFGTALQAATAQNEIIRCTLQTGAVMYQTTSLNT